MEKDLIRIGNAGGFWGDDLSALRRQIEDGELDYITSDYLAEITMGILMKQKMKDPNMGYVYDFLFQIEEVLELIVEKGVRIITNAGGINPEALAKKIADSAKSKGLNLKVAAVTGDDILNRINELVNSGEKMTNMETGEDFKLIKNSVLSSNVYLGVSPVVKALSEGADIIVTGRVTDTAITLAPMVYEFNWKLDDWNRLASGVVGGHIIECGSQSTGGNFTDWRKIKFWDNIGFPVLEVKEDGSFVVTKHKNTGGIVSEDSVKEQLLYEMGDPKNYLSPDVTVDFSSISLKEISENRVEVSGVKGYPSTKFFKVSTSFENGFTAAGSILIGGTDNKSKADVFDKIFWEKIGCEFEKKNSEILGSTEDTGSFSKAILRFSVYDHDKEKIAKFGSEISTLILSGPAGAAVTGGRPKPRMVIGYWPSLIKKTNISSNIIVYDADSGQKYFKVESVTGYERDINTMQKEAQDEEIQYNSDAAGGSEILLGRLCLARSGDKGDTSNIGVIARNDVIFEILKRYLTPQKIKEIFSDVCHGIVTRFTLENLNAFNFLLEESLGGGGGVSLLSDPQGKLYAQRLLASSLVIDDNSLEEIEKSLKMK